MKFNKNQFNEEQLIVIQDTSRLEKVFEELMNIVSNEEINITRKRTLMFQYLILFMQQRKQDFLNVGIKKSVADSLVKRELKTLDVITKELNDVVSKN